MSDPTTPNPNNHGGPRPNSGRKSNATRSIPAPLSHARTLLAQAMTDQDWIDAFKALLAIIKTSEDARAKISAFRILAEYRFGKPDADAFIESEPTPAAAAASHNGTSETRQKHDAHLTMPLDLFTRPSDANKKTRYAFQRKGSAAVIVENT